MFVCVLLVDCIVGHCQDKVTFTVWVTVVCSNLESKQWWTCSTSFTWQQWETSPDPVLILQRTEIDIPGTVSGWKNLFDPEFLKYMFFYVCLSSFLGILECRNNFVLILQP